MMRSLNRAEVAADVGQTPDLAKLALFLLRCGRMPKSVVHEEVG